MGSDWKFDENIALMVASQRKEGEDVMGAKLQGGYVDYIHMMVEKHSQYGCSINIGDDLIVIDSFDGAEHLKSKKKVMNVISFSSCLYTSDMIASRVVSAASSFNILTWQQILGKEELSVLLPALGDYFVTEQLKRQQHSTPNTYYYELHDGKMLYMLTQHSLWNRKHHSFLLCACH